MLLNSWAGHACCTELTPAAGWTHRQTLLTYCLTTVHHSLEAKKAEMSGQDEKLAAPARNGADAGRRVRGLKEEEVFVSLATLAPLFLLLHVC